MHDNKTADQTRITKRQNDSKTADQTRKQRGLQKEKETKKT